MSNLGFEAYSAWYLLLLILLPILWWWWKQPRHRTALAYSSTSVLRKLPRSWAVKTRWILPAIRTVVLALLIVALARPQKADAHRAIHAEGVAIEMVIDRSGSMRADDFVVDGRRVTRLEAAKAVAEDFILGTDDLEGRPHDLIGLITFAKYADAVAAMTFDHQFLGEKLADLKPLRPNDKESATAIGDAIALAVERLASLETSREMDTDKTVTSKIIILLTDGEDNASAIMPMKAAEMAAAYDIKLYTIGIGTDRGEVPVLERDVFGRTREIRMRVEPVDEKLLTKMADLTGGQYFRAFSTDSLVDIYSTIDELEKSQLFEEQFVEQSELAVEHVTLGSLSLPPLVLAALILLLLETVLATTRYRTLP